MSTLRWLALGVLAFAAVAVLVAVVRPRPDGAPESTVRPSLLAIPTSIAAVPSPSASGAPVSTPVDSPLAASSPTARAPSRTTAPRATGDPRLAYAEFLLRVNDDRSTVDDLNRALAVATDARDLKAVRTAAVRILDFVDAERDWLREHPPADCYAQAHGPANAMLAAYGTAADRFVDWSAADGGLTGLTALGRAVDAAGVAADSLTAFGKALEATTCRA